jgi:hypothetical protein
MALSHSDNMSFMLIDATSEDPFPPLLAGEVY